MSSLSVIFPLLPLATMMFAASITPGPNNILIMTAGAHVGFRACWPHLWGISLGFMFQAFTVIMGLGLLFVYLPWLKTAMGIAATLYLLWMAWGLAQHAWRAGREKLPSPEAMTALSENPSTKSKRVRHDPRKPMTFLQACAFQWVNPKAWTMAIAVPSGFLPSQWQPFIAVPAALMTLTLVNLPCVALWAVMGASLRQHLQTIWVARVFYGSMALAMLWTAYYMAPR